MRRSVCPVLKGRALPVHPEHNQLQQVDQVESTLQHASRACMPSSTANGPRLSGELSCVYTYVRCSADLQEHGGLEAGEDDQHGEQAGVHPARLIAQLLHSFRQLLQQEAVQGGVPASPAISLLLSRGARRSSPRMLHLG
jgi:hypothetical protein